MEPPLPFHGRASAVDGKGGGGGRNSTGSLGDTSGIGDVSGDAPTRRTNMAGS
jgi:hypothetical protein